jgi:tetratricopeptide (TPR) repeat protein
MSTHRPLPINPDHQDEVLDELIRLREEAISTRNITIKTENLIKGLSVEFKQVSVKQAHQERRSLFNSAIAYVLFVLLIFSGLYLNFTAKVEAINAKKDLKLREIESLNLQLNDLKTQLENWKQIERKLLEFARLVREDNKEEAVRSFSSLRNLSFSGLLEELIVKFKGEVAREKYEQGVQSYKEQKAFSQANELFKASLTYDATPPYLGDMLYYQGMCALRLKNYDKATKLLKKAQTFKHDRKVRANIHYHIARAYDMLGDKHMARRLYFKFYKTFGHSEKHKAGVAKRRYERLERSRNR